MDMEGFVEEDGFWIALSERSKIISGCKKVQEPGLDIILMNLVGKCVHQDFSTLSGQNEDSHLEEHNRLRQPSSS